MHNDNRFSDYILNYKNAGFAVIPVHFRAKNPVASNWPARSPHDCSVETDFPNTEPRNVGIVLGKNSGSIVDIDLDCPEAVKLAPYFLPETGMIFGRDSKPASHWLYRISGSTETKRLQTSRGVLLEIRGDGAQTVFPPSVHPSGETVRFEVSGEPSQISRDELEEAVQMLAAATLLAQNWAEGNRHDLAMALAGGLLKGEEWSLEEVCRFLEAVCSVAGDKEIKDRQQAVEDTARKIAQGSEATGFPTLERMIGKEATQKIHDWLLNGQKLEQMQALSTLASGLGRYTDLGNVQRFVSEHKQGLRFVSDMRQWLVWTGKKWAENAELQAHECAHKTVEKLIAEVRGAGSESEKSDGYQWAKRSGNKERIGAMVQESRSYLALESKTLDQRSMLLNCENGTLNLETGELQDHRQDDMLTQVAPVSYNSDAACPLFMGFLERIFDGDRGLIDYIQRAIGYSLTGKADEQCFFVCYGHGANGKSTFLNVLEEILADYACATPTKTLMANKFESGISNDVARLRGKRLVKAVEGESTHELSEALIKQFTGGDTVTARFMRQEFFEFKPIGKIWLLTNHRPKIKGTDHGIWRRVRLIPFEVTIPENEKDPKLGEKLLAERAGILAWAVQGCLEWQRQGLKEPSKVRAATDEYRREMDSVSTFLQERILEARGHYIPKKDLYEGYFWWCGEYGYDCVEKKSFGTALKARGFVEDRKGKGGPQVWLNIRLIEEENPNMPKIVSG